MLQWITCAILLFESGEIPQRKLMAQFVRIVIFRGENLADT